MNVSTLTPKRLVLWHKYKEANTPMTVYHTQTDKETVGKMEKLKQEMARLFPNFDWILK